MCQSQLWCNTRQTRKTRLCTLTNDTQQGCPDFRDSLYHLYMQVDSSIFKAYDIRGIYPQQLNEDVAYMLGRAYATWLLRNTPATPGKKMKVAVGSDMRLSSPALKKRVIDGVIDTGLDVEDIG